MKAGINKALSKLPKKKWWWVASTLAVAVWCFAGVVVGQLVVAWPMYWILGKEQFNQPVWSAVYSALAYIIALLIIILIPMALFRKWHVTRKDLGLDSLPTWTDIGLAPIGFLVATILAAIITNIFTMFPWFDVEAVQDVGFNYYITGFDRVIAFVTLVIIAPIAEEIIFRGWLYGLVRKKTSPKMANIWSVILSSLLVSLLFGLIHFQWNVGVNVFAMSLVLCAMREITGTIYSGILMHMIKNGVAFWLLYIMGVH